MPVVDLETPTLCLVGAPLYREARGTCILIVDYISSFGSVYNLEVML